MNPYISELEAMVRARGLNLAKANPETDLLLPPSGGEEDLTAYRQILDHYAARLLLKEIIQAGTVKRWKTGRERVQRFCESDSVDEYLFNFSKLGVITCESGFPRITKPVHSFGPTYEWYTSMVLVTDFRCPSAWGVTFDGQGSGGDHDVIGYLSGHFLYMEVKTSPPGRIESPEIGGFVRRLHDIAPDLAVFHNDTHLRMKDKIVPLMEEAIDEEAKDQRAKAKEGGFKPARFERLEREIFHLGASLYIINSKPDLRRNLEVVFRHYFRSKNRVLDAIS